MKMNSPVRRLLLGMFCASLTSVAVLANETATEPTGNDAGSITITGKRGSERYRIMLDFVSKLGEPVSGDVGYARLEEAPCYLVQNLPKPALEYLTARLTSAAHDVGLTKTKSDCEPNVVILFTEDSKALADSLVKNRRGLIKPFFNSEGTVKDAHALQDFATSDAPIRWWQVTVPVDWAGRYSLPGLDLDYLAGNAVAMVQGTESRITRSLRDRLLYTIVVVDLNKLGEATWDQLSDYLAMVSLVQVKPGTSMAGYDTILNLFARGASAPPVLSDWDKAYLHGVYDLNRYLTPFSQRGALTYQVLNNFYK